MRIGSYRVVRVRSNYFRSEENLGVLVPIYILNTLDSEMECIN